MPLSCLLSAWFNLVALQSCALLQAYNLQDCGSHRARVVNVLANNRPGASVDLGWLVSQSRGRILIHRPLHWDEVVSAVWSLCLSNEETETHRLAHRIPSNALSTIAEHGKEDPSPTLSAYFIYLQCMSSTLPFLHLYFCMWVLCHFKKAQGSKSEVWKSQPWALMWVLALCLQHRCRGAWGGRFSHSRYSYVMKSKDAEGH